MVRPAFFILQRCCLLKVLHCCFVFDIASSGVIFSRHLDAVVDLFRLWVLGRHQENSWWAGLVFGVHSWH